MTQGRIKVFKVRVLWGPRDEYAWLRENMTRSEKKKVSVQVISTLIVAALIYLPKYENHKNTVIKKEIKNK